MINNNKTDWGNYSDEELIKGCIKQDRKFQRILYSKYAAIMYNICLSYIGDRELAQDILQEGFIKVFTNIKNFVQTGSLEGWIRKTIVNTSIDYFRKKSKLHKYIVNDSIADAEDIQDDVLDKLSTEEILRRVAELPDGARIIFNLYALEGYSHKEIADKLNISIGTSKSQLSRAKNLLKKWLMENP